MSAYDTLALAACNAVAALLPGTDVQDDGGGPYITGPASFELFVMRPEDAQEPRDAWHWQFQTTEPEEQIVAMSETTILDDPEDVAAWARTMLPAKPETCHFCGTKIEPTPAGDPAQWRAVGQPDYAAHLCRESPASILYHRPWEPTRLPEHLTP